MGYALGAKWIERHFTKDHVEGHRPRRLARARRPGQAVPRPGGDVRGAHLQEDRGARHRERAAREAQVPQEVGALRRDLRRADVTAPFGLATWLREKRRGSEVSVPCFPPLRLCAPVAVQVSTVLS